MIYHGTVLQFVGHSCVLIRYRDHMVLADPWYLQPAVGSWVPCPPPTVSVEMWPALAKTGKLAVLLSHMHGDHVDPQFLETLPTYTPMIVPEYEDHHMANYLRKAGFTHVSEIPDSGHTWGPFQFNRVIDPSTHADAPIGIETPDSFILHGNDAWQLTNENIEKVRAFKPAKMSLLMGQGGSASGHPLTYSDYTWEKRIELLELKNKRMLNGLSVLRDILGFDRILAYACFTAVKVLFKDYSFKAPTPTGAYANAVCDTEAFLDLSPGDIYLPAEDLVIPVLQTLHVPMTYFKTADVHPEYLRLWQPSHSAKLTDFLEQFKRFAETTTRFPSDELALDFEVVVKIPGQDRPEIHRVSIFGGKSGRKKTCRVDAGVMAGVLDKRFPFENLYTGYLAEWSRTPDYYNSDFLNCLNEFGYRFMSGS